MAGLYVAFGRPDRERIQKAADRLRFFDESVNVISIAGADVAWIGHDDPQLFGPARDRRTGVTVITSGRISWPENDWARGERLVELEGGLSNRLLLERYLRFGPEGVDRHNGPAAVLVADPRDQTIHLWTDHFGYHPAFLYAPDDLDRAVISTFTDAIAADPNVNVSLDEVSHAEFLSAWRITPPHTYYREIKHAGAASHHTWNTSSRTYSRREYWRPEADRPRFPDIDAAAEELAAAIRHAVQIRTLERLGPIVSFTSGGLDSRAVLFAASSPSSLIGLNLYDVPNKESSVAQRLCEAAGVRYEGYARDNDYYPRWMTDGVSLSGGMLSAEDNHFLGTRDVVRKLGARTVMTACTTDWLFKGYGLEADYRRLAGRNLPIRKLTSRRVDGFLPNVPRGVPREFANEAAARLDSWFAGTKSNFETDADWREVEDRRIRPACYVVSVSGPVMYRVFPYDTFLADARMADVYSGCRAEWKLNSEVWGRAVRRICAAGGQIEDANFGWKAGSSTAMKLSMFAVGWFSRRLRPRAADPTGLATDGSWPNFGYYLRNSALFAKLWNSPPAGVREQVASAWGSDPWSVSLDEWAKNPNDCIRILTLAMHLAKADKGLTRD